LFVVVLQGEHPGIGTVGIGQELAQRVGVFEGAAVELLEAIALIDRRNRAQNFRLPSQVAGTAVGETTRRLARYPAQR
jgi:hypothetical protein